jgi:5-methylcytosine-specific restriction endonuclease McrA
MPTLPSNNKCASLGCFNNRSRLSTFCIEHGGRDTYVARKSIERKKFNSMYDKSSWKKLRQAKLSMQPMCQACLIRGVVSPASQVDHLFAWSAIGELAFYRNIFQCLCHGCHSDKTQLERDGVYRHYNGAETDYSIDDYHSVLGIAAADLSASIQSHGAGKIL